MMRAYRALQLAVLTFALSSAPAAAQVPDSTRSRLRDLFGVADNRNWYLRVVTADDHQIEGNIGRESGDAVRVGSTLVSFESIRFVHRRRMEGGATGGGAFVGGIAGGLLGLLTAGIACGISEGTCNTTMARLYRGRYRVRRRGRRSGRIRPEPWRAGLDARMAGPITRQSGYRAC
jgi:hypothetical protein